MLLQPLFGYIAEFCWQVLPFVYAKNLCWNFRSRSGGEVDLKLSGIVCLSDMKRLDIMSESKSMLFDWRGCSYAGLLLC